MCWLILPSRVCKLFHVKVINSIVEYTVQVCCYYDAKIVNFISLRLVSLTTRIVYSTVELCIEPSAYSRV